jgi:hypothetical protein
MKIRVSQDNLTYTVAEITFCAAKFPGSAIPLTANSFENEVLTNYCEIFRNISRVYGRLKLKISLPAAIATYCFEPMA